MSPVGFEPTISAGERPQTYALDWAATGTGISMYSSKFDIATQIEEDSFFFLTKIQFGM